jgi:hypothetical protein
MKKHYYLVTGTVVFVNNNGPEPEMGTTPAINAMIIMENNCVPQSGLKQAQASLMTQFASRVQQSGDDFQKIQVVDIVIGNLNYLGEMSGEQFYDVQPANDSDEAIADAVLDLAQMGRDQSVN